MATERLYLGIDAGIQTTGWATMRPGEALQDFGFLKPDTKGTPSFQRIEELCHGLGALLEEHRPGVVVLEWDGGHVNRNRHEGGGAGLAVHGAVTASLWRDCVWWARRHGADVIVVPESKWTRGRPKPERALAVAGMFPAYRPELDKGFDAADAIGVLIWFQREEMVQRRKGEF